MADVRVRYVGKAPIVVNDTTWFEDEIHTISEKLARSLLAFGEQVVVLPPLPSPASTGSADGAEADGAVGEGEGLEVVEEAPVRRKRK